MVTFPMTLTDPNPVFKVTAFLKSTIVRHLKLLLHKRKLYLTWNGTTSGDLDWPKNASRRSVSDSWVSCYQREVVSAAYATATWLGGWLPGCLCVTAGIVSKRLNLS